MLNVINTRRCYSYS